MQSKEKPKKEQKLIKEEELSSQDKELLEKIEFYVDKLKNDKTSSLSSNINNLQ